MLVDARTAYNLISCIEYIIVIDLRDSISFSHSYIANSLNYPLVCAYERSLASETLPVEFLSHDISKNIIISNALTGTCNGILLLYGIG